MTPTDPPDKGKPLVAANDNGDTNHSDPEALRKVDDVVLMIARLIGRRMARENFERTMRAANDNAPKSGGEPDGGARKA